MQNITSVEKYTQTLLPKAGLEFFYTGEDAEPHLDNSRVREDELLMRLGHFWGYDNVAGQQTFFEIHSNNLRESVHSVVSRCSNRIRQLILGLALHHRMSPLTSLEN